MTNSNLGKILIVDDEVELKNVLVEALAARGYLPLGFTSGEAAIEALRETAFDILLTDLMMPGMDGIALVKEAMQIDPNVICIMMTGQGTIQTAVDAMKGGAFDYVLKPFRLQTMLPVLTRAMNARHLRLENVQLREAVAIHELSETIAFTLDPQTVLSKLADAALLQSEADEVSVLLPTASGQEFYVAAVRGEKRERLLGERIPFGESISSWVARQHEPVILNGEVDDNRFVALWPRADIRSSVSVPMLVAKKLVGVLNLNMVERLRPFTLGQMKALMILAGTAAAALESASLYTQVRKAEENYRSIFENAVEGIFRATPDGQRFISVNPAMAHMFGYDSPAEMVELAQDISQKLGVDPERIEGAVTILGEDGVLKDHEEKVRRKDGSELWICAHLRAVRDNAGKLTYLDGIVQDVTERKQAEEKLRQSEGDLAEAQHLAHVGSWNWDILNDSLTWSDEHYHIFGHEPEDFDPTYESVATHVVPEDRDLFKSVIDGCLEDHQPFSFYYHIRRPNGEVRVVHAGGSLLCDERGTPIRMVGTAQDVTERRQAEAEQARLSAEIKQHTDRLNTIVATVPGVVFEVSGRPGMPDNETNFVSEYIGPMLSYTVSEWMAVPAFWLSIVHPDDRQRVQDEVAAEFAQGRNSGHEFRWMGKDGRIVWVRAHTVIVRDDEGNPMGVRGVVTDITERKRSEQELSTSEERYRDLVENAHDIIFTHDLKGNYTSMNTAGAQITGYTPEESLTLNLTQTVAPEYLPKVREMLARKLAGEPVTAYEMEIVAKDGHRITVEANTKLVYHDGVPIGVQGIARDITERKQLEDQLRQSQKMEAIGQLAGGVAHDFNNLLTAINGYSSLALQRIDANHPLRGYLEEIKKAGDRAANLTRQLLAFGRKQILQPLPINLNDIVTDMNKMLQRLIGEDIVLTAKLDSALKRIKADPGQIEQVLMNLVVNARDAMPQGGNLTIETATIDLDEDYAGRHVGVVTGRYVMLAVSDTGTGMDEATRAQIFDPFFTTKEKGKGTGLGLSTVYGIVKQSGGNILVYSEPSHGTAFKIYLPEMITEPRRLAATVVEPEPRGVETIMLVEDEDVVRGLAKQILEQSGYKVLAASRGEEAIRLCAQSAEPIHLLLTDVVMPETSGKEVADRLREAIPGLRVLFMSGYTDQAIVHHGVLDSNVEFIQKPFTPSSLVRRVREVLDAKLVSDDDRELPAPARRRPRSERRSLR